MKKFMSALLILAMVFTFAACGSVPEPAPETTASQFQDWRIEVEGVEGVTTFTSEDAAYLRQIDNPLYIGIRLIDVLQWMRPNIMAQSNAWTVTAIGADGTNIEYWHDEVPNTILAWGIRGVFVPPCMSSNGVVVDVYDVVKIVLNG